MFRSPQITLYSRNLPRALAFYQRLGFSLSFRYPREGELEHVELLLDGFNLGIAAIDSVRRNHGAWPDPDGAAMEIVLWTDDTDAEFERLVAAGARALSAPHDWLGRLRVAWIADPDGNPIQLVEKRA